MKQVSFLETSLDDAQVSRDERAFRLWLNSLGISTYINNVFEDLRNGYIMGLSIFVFSADTLQLECN